MTGPSDGIFNDYDEYLGSVLKRNVNYMHKSYCDEVLYL
jgi:hypothetical protein